MPPSSVPQSLTVDYKVSGSLDGTTPSPEVSRSATAFNADQQIYQPEAVENLGLIDPDLGTGGSIGPRCITQLFINLKGVTAPAGAKVVVGAQEGDTVTELFGVLDLAGKTTAYAPLPFVVPQGAVIQIVGVDAGADGILVRTTIETPDDPCGVQATLALASEMENGNGGNGGCPCLKLSEDVVTEAGSRELEVGIIQQFDASGLDNDEMELVLPASPELHQEVGVKEVGDSFVDVILNGNGNDVETLTDAPAATQTSGLARQSLTWQFDGAGTWRLI